MDPTGFTENEAEVPPVQTLTLNERLTIKLKEYDALRKEAEQSLSLMPDIGKSVGLAIAGALIAANRTSFGRVIALCAPAVIMAALGAVSHAHAKLETVSRRLMMVEDCVFQMSGEPLLTHETQMNRRRLERGGNRWTLAALVGSMLYLTITMTLYRQFKDVFSVGNGNSWSILYWIMVGTSGLYAVFSAVRIGWQRKHIPRTKLLVEPLHLDPPML